MLIVPPAPMTSLVPVPASNCFCACIGRFLSHPQCHGGVTKQTGISSYGCDVFPIVNIYKLRHKRIKEHRRKAITIVQANSADAFDGKAV